jgi:hypothetical protein
LVLHGQLFQVIKERTPSVFQSNTADYKAYHISYMIYCQVPPAAKP